MHALTDTALPPHMPARFARLAPMIAALILPMVAEAAAADAARLTPQALSQALPARLQPQAAGILRNYLRLTQQATPDEAPTEPTPGRIDPTLPSVALPQLLATIDGLLAKLPTPLVPPLQAARGSFERASALLVAGSDGGSLGYLVNTLGAAAEGQAGLEQALDLAAVVDPSAIALLLPAVQSARESARRCSQGVIDRALAAGVSPEQLAPALEAMRLADSLHARGDYAQAMVQHANALGFAAQTIVFSLDRFEQNLRQVFDANSTGWAYAIASGGQLARSDASGQARTVADSPQRVQSPTRKMHVASVSKTLSAIAIQRLLAGRGLTPDADIGPWLPSDWLLGQGVAGISFRQLMTHRSGFGQAHDLDLTARGSSYANLRQMVADGLLLLGDRFLKDFDYDNANFGLLRVLSARLQNVDLGAPQLAGFDKAALASAMFLAWVQPLYGGIGVPYTCEPAASAPTLDYQFPDSGQPGWPSPPYSLSCGGLGSFMSASELVRVLSFLRYTANLLAPAEFQRMRSQSLGFMDPADWPWPAGVFGTTLMHGGDWSHSTGSLDACIAAFPITIEAAIVVNSSTASDNYPNGGYQCGVLQQAFDNAWVMP